MCLSVSICGFVYLCVAFGSFFSLFLYPVWSGFFVVVDVVLVLIVVCLICFCFVSVVAVITCSMSKEGEK